MRPPSIVDVENTENIFSQQKTQVVYEEEFKGYAEHAPLSLNPSSEDNIERVKRSSTKI